MDDDIKFGLQKIKEHLILTQEHLDYPCPTCYAKHFDAISAYASELIPMVQEEELRDFLIRLKDWSERKKAQLDSSVI